MEEQIDVLSATSWNLKIKKEPIDEDGTVENEEEDYVTKSLILKFIKDSKGDYSVVPLIKPDPYFEENLDDFCNEVSTGEIKSEEDSLCFEKDENFNIKQEYTDYDIKEEGGRNVTPIENDIYDNNKIEDDDSLFAIRRCPSCLYTNTKKMVQRHIQRVHVSITKHFCAFCDKKNFKEPLSVDCHILRHHRDIKGSLNRIKRTIFECTFCTYKTLKRNNYRRHLSTHGDGTLRRDLEKKKKNKESVVEIDLKDEMKKALSKSTFSCFHCPYTTKDKGSISKHLRLHRGTTELPHFCKACNKNFNEKNSLDSHIVKRHLNNQELLGLVTSRVYECELCDYKDVNKNKVVRHKKARHVKKEKRRRKFREGKIKLHVVRK